MAYTTPAKKPTEMAETEPNVTASPKNIIPEAATGNLFSAPTMLTMTASQSEQPVRGMSIVANLYVVLLVTRTHHAVVYDIPTAAAPEKAMAKSKILRVSSGLYQDTVSSKSTTVRTCKRPIKEYVQVPHEICVRPIFRYQGKNCEHWDRQQVIVEHRVPVRETCCLDAFAHGEDLHTTGQHHISVANGPPT